MIAEEIQQLRLVKTDSPFLKQAIILPCRSQLHVKFIRLCVPRVKRVVSLCQWVPWAHLICLTLLPVAQVSDGFCWLGISCWVAVVSSQDQLQLKPRGRGHCLEDYVSMYNWVKIWFENPDHNQKPHFLQNEYFDCLVHCIKMKPDRSTFAVL